MLANQSFLGNGGGAAVFSAPRTGTIFFYPHRRCVPSYSNRNLLQRFRGTKKARGPRVLALDRSQEASYSSELGIPRQVHSVKIPVGDRYVSSTRFLEDVE